ncbi:MAG: hypothetical protein LC115_11120 [Bacteroidia bacterium]|nr:hypothetical protein [Bacteroidia bacterium]
MNNPANKYGVKRPDSPYTSEECEQIIQELEELLDGEISQEKAESIQSRIESCEFCLEQYNLERSFRALLRNKVSQTIESNQTLKSLQNSILNLAKRLSQNERKQP